MRTIYTHFRYKEPALDVQPCVIEKVVELPAEKYSNFCRHLTEDYDFIQECAEELYKDGNGISHCLLVLGAGSRDGVLVRSEGYGWARYHAYLPNARQFVDMDRHPSLDDMNQEAVALVNKFVKRAIDCQLDGRYRVTSDEIRNSPGNKYCQDNLIAEILSETPEIELVEEVDNEIYLYLAPEYVMQEDTQAIGKITAKDVDIMCAKHTLWLNGVGGERADFSNCLMENLDLSRRNLEHASFAGTRMVGCSFYQANVSESSFAGARIHDCEMTDITAVGATFTDTQFRDTQLNRGFLNQSNFSRASFSNSSIDSCHMSECCFDSTDFGDADLKSAWADRCSYDENDWQVDDAPGMQM